MLETSKVWAWLIYLNELNYKLEIDLLKKSKAWAMTLFKRTELVLLKQHNIDLHDLIGPI